jgi:hypothetical protein
MSHWNSLLVKTTLSPALIEDCVAVVAVREKAVCRKALSIAVNSAVSLKELRASVREWRPALPGALAQHLDEELREIVADARWAKTSRGAYVRAVSSWVEVFHAEFRGMHRFSDVFIGAHADREIVFVSGAVGSRQILDELMSYLASKSPPFKLDVDIKVSGRCISE